VVVFARDEHQHTANGDMVIVDKGANDGLKVGDVLLAVRTKVFPVGPDGDRKGGTETTTHYIGQALVVRTDSQTATCRLLRTTEEIRLGDTLTH
jgi:hypothetical protein